MRKFTIIFIILALVLSLSVPAFAYESGDKVEVSLFRRAAGPSYTVSIPATIVLTLNEEGVDLPVVVTDLENLGNKAVAITYENALRMVIPYSWYDNPRFAVVNFDVTSAEYYSVLGYGIRDAYNGVGSYSEGFGPGRELMRFTANGTQYLGFRIVTDKTAAHASAFDVNKILSGSAYEGYIVFGIKLIDADSERS